MKKILQLVVMTMCISALLALFGCGIKDRFIVDGPDMERRTVWTSFTISKSSDLAEENYSYTVTRNESEDSYYVFYEYFDYENNVPDEKTVKLKSKAVSELLAMNLVSLPDVVEESSDESEEEILILDETKVRLVVCDVYGCEGEKVISFEQADEIREILRPYVE